MPELIPTPNAPAAAGPYSPAMRAGDWIVLAGQVGIDPATNKLVSGGIEAEARQVLANVTAALADAGCDWEHVAKVTVFVATESPQPMPGVNAIYQEVVGEHLPTRSTVGVAWLPLGASIEIEAWAHAPTG
jgi:2-iminobutanoate/2-iminopropanoate deaminase